MNRFDITSLIDFAQVVDRDGLDAHPATLFALADRASELGVSDVVLGVMLSAQEPPVARERAFNRAAAVVAHRRSRSSRFASAYSPAVAV